MLTVIIDARAGTEGLASLLAQLTAGAVDGIVREVRIVARPDQPGIDLLSEDMGADVHETLDAAGQAARCELALVLNSDFRFRDGWIGALNAHLSEGGGPARIVGLGAGGILARGAEGALVACSRVADAKGADLKRLRRSLGFNARRVG